MGSRNPPWEGMDLLLPTWGPQGGASVLSARRGCTEFKLRRDCIVVPAAGHAVQLEGQRFPGWSRC